MRPQFKINRPGVYCFWHSIPTGAFPLPTNQVYVGSAENLRKRLNRHLKNINSNIHLQRALALYGLEAFHISYVTTETYADALQLEQKCLDHLFGDNLPKYNIADKVGGGCIGTKAQHRELCLQGRTKAQHRELSLKGKSREEYREFCESNGGCKAIKRFAMDLTTGIIHEFESAHEAADFTGVYHGYIPASCKTGKPFNGSTARWVFSTDKADLTHELLTDKEKRGSNKYKFVLYKNGKLSEEFNSTCKAGITRSNLRLSLQGQAYQVVKGNLVLITELNGLKISNPIAEYKARFSHVTLTKRTEKFLKEAELLFSDSDHK